MAGFFKSIKSQFEALTDVKRYEEARSMAPLISAIDKGDAYAVQVLVKNNPGYLNKYSLKGETPLHYAVRTGKVGVAKALVQAGADLNLPVQTLSPYDSLIHLAVISGEPDMIVFLRSAGVSLSTKAKNHLTPLRHAISLDDGQMVKALIEQGADVFEVSLRGKTPFLSALAENKGSSVRSMLSFPEVQKKLSRDFTESHFKGVSPVFTALEIGYFDTARRIFDMGAPVNCQDDKGNTPLHWAVYHKDAEFVEYLIKKGAQITGIHNKAGLTPFHLLCSKADDFDDRDVEKVLNLLVWNSMDVFEETKSRKSFDKLVDSSKNKKFKTLVQKHRALNKGP